MDITTALKYWNDIGKRDPLWAILKDRSKKGNRWDSEAFFATGREEIDALMLYVASLAVPLQKRRAFDFGCGVGRLSQAIAKYYAEVHGVDISQSMIDAARGFNRFGERVQYHVNEENDLRQFPDGHFDLIYTNITLQHIEPVDTRKYLQEFLRILAPQGLLIFQLPTEPARTWVGYVYRYVPMAWLNFARRLVFGMVMELHGILRDQVVALLQQGGGRIVDIRENQVVSRHWISLQYCVTKD